MDTKALRKGFGSAAGSKAQIAAYHDALVKAAVEIDRLRQGLDRLVRIYESEQDAPLPCERPVWLRELLTPNMLKSAVSAANPLD